MTPRRFSDAVATLGQRVHGRGTLSRGEVHVDVAFALEGSIYRPGEAWQLVAYGPSYDAPEWQPLLRAGDGALTLHGVADDGRNIRLKDVRWNQHEGHRLTAAIHDVRYDCEPAEFVPTERHATVYLTHTQLALPQPDSLLRSWTGELHVPPQFERDVPRAPVIIHTGAGDARLQLIYDWNEIGVEGATGDVRVPVPALILTVAADFLATDPAPLLSTIDDGISDLLEVLSLLSRRFVRWTRMTLITHAERDGGVQGHVRSEWVRTVAPPRTRESRRDDLVLPGRLPVDALERMVHTYGAHPKKHAVRAAVTYCLAAQDAPHLETSFMSAFTAVEALLAADTPRPDPALAATLDYSELRRRIAAAITTYTAEQGLPGHIADLLTHRVGNLTGRATADRVCDLVAASGIHWDDLWPAATSLELAIRRAFRRRNEFFHRGQFPEPRQAHVDARRLSILCERLLFALVGGEEAWVSPWAYDNVPFLASHPA